jgi:hypothetical protein
VVTVAVTTAMWIGVAHLTAPTDHQTLVSFYRLL